MPLVSKMLAYLGVNAALVLLAAPAGALAAPVTFKHVVIIVQENRSLDHLFGSNPKFEPGVDIATSGVNSSGQTVPLTPVPLSVCWDAGHTHSSFVKMYNSGKMDGADKIGVRGPTGCVVPPNATFSYVDNSTGTIEPYFQIARQFGFANRMFQSNQGPSYPAHQFIFGGTSQIAEGSPLFVAENGASKTDTVGCTAPSTQTVAVIDGAGSETSNPQVYPCYERPTLTDRLEAARLTWKYYTIRQGGMWNAPTSIQHICQPGMKAGKLQCLGQSWKSGLVVGPTQILTDIQTCNLANVVWSTPTAAASDHAKITDGTGPAWVASIVNAIATQPTCPNGDNYWNSTAIFITWDDWGGFYDHVPPFRIGASNGWGQSYVYGFRVPLLVVSAYTPPGYVDNTILDFGSLLSFIEYNFKLPKIGAGTFADAYAVPPLGFFPLQSPRTFQPIQSRHSAHYFLTRPEDNRVVDDDQ